MYFFEVVFSRDKGFRGGEVVVEEEEEGDRPQSMSSPEPDQVANKLAWLGTKESNHTYQRYSLATVSEQQLGLAEKQKRVMITSKVIVL